MSGKEHYKRTTITIPRDVYQRMRVLAANQQKSVSGFVSDLLHEKTGADGIDGAERDLPIGKYARGRGEPRRRKDIYDDHLEQKVSS